MIYISGDPDLLADIDDEDVLRVIATWPQIDGGLRIAYALVENICGDEQAYSDPARAEYLADLVVETAAEVPA